MPASYKAKRTVELVITEDGDDRVLKRIDLKIVLAFTLEYPESGRFGPPENYDPGSPALVEIDSATCEFVGIGGALSRQATDGIAEEYIRINSDALISDLNEEMSEDLDL